MINQNFELERETENSASLLKFDSALKTAVKLLSKRDFSTLGMKDALSRLEYDEPCISDVIEHLLQVNYLDDERLAINLLKKYVGRGKGPHYIKNEFFKRGLVFSMESYRQFLLNEGVTSSDHMLTTLERAARKYLNKCDSSYDFERKVLSYLFRQGQIQDQSEIGLYKSTLRQLWSSKEIQGSN
ncbi:MAG: hypothetical protein A2X86_05870 [Bdellovibrionales bacterium GWA2_49_15]|nr:MAG: hypothetical protein A2X86_05870 [Bdellovibrionales bacterium GWA2_49_15]